MDYEETTIEKWTKGKDLIAVGDTVICTVRSHHPFGVLVSVEPLGVNGVIERIRMGRDGYQTPDEYPPVGSLVRASVVGFREYSRQVEVFLPRKPSTDSASDSFVETVEIGLRMNPDGNLTFFGVEYLNGLLARSKRILRVEDGRALMIKSGESSDSISMRLNGFSVSVVVAPD